MKINKSNCEKKVWETYLLLFVYIHWCNHSLSLNSCIVTDIPIRKIRVDIWSHNFSHDIPFYTLKNIKLNSIRSTNTILSFKLIKWRYQYTFVIHVTQICHLRMHIDWFLSHVYPKQHTVPFNLHYTCTLYVFKHLNIFHYWKWYRVFYKDFN